jgi:hypothetical protein
MHTLDNAEELNLTELLNRARGKVVTLLIGENQMITGKIRAGVDYSKTLTKMLVIEEIEGREYFDLAVPKDYIRGIMVRRPDSP